jgi:UDP-N-acetylmuramyl pentapeptide phosphotransferase/UDP-N-acetylglucosamine-1-phosphate transferase
MRLQSWQITYIVGVLLGLLVGWEVNPWLGTVFILMFVIVFEILSFIRQRGSAKPSSTENNESRPEPVANYRNHVRRILSLI